MKMTPEHYNTMKTKIDKFIESAGIALILEYKANHSDMRFRWDLFHHAFCFDSATYQYLNDDHIDTALKHYIKNNPLLN
jgi:hypothetical protein